MKEELSELLLLAPDLFDNLIQNHFGAVLSKYKDSEDLDAVFEELHTLQTAAEVMLALNSAKLGDKNADKFKLKARVFFTKVFPQTHFHPFDWFRLPPD